MPIAAATGNATCRAGVYAFLSAWTAATTSDGVIHLYPGTGTGLQARVRIGAGSTSRIPLA